MIEYRQPHRRLISRLQQVLSKQALVQSRSNLSHKDTIVTILKWLIGARKVRMHRMPQFVRQGIHAIPLVLEIQQDKRASLVPSAAIRPTTLPWSLVDIDPPLLKRLLENSRIILAQGSKGSYNSITCIRVGYFISSFLYDWYIQIVHMQLIEVEQAFAQFHIPVEQVEMLANRLHQVIINTDRKSVV